LVRGYRKVTPVAGILALVAGLTTIILTLVAFGAPSFLSVVEVPFGVLIGAAILYVWLRLVDIAFVRSILAREG
jgi:hypothetical protein